MTNLFTAKTNFTAGELSHDLLGRVDLRSYENGALELKNVFIEPTGGVRRRPGLRHVDTLQGDGRLICFEKNPKESYLIVLHDLEIHIYLHGTKIADLVSPYTAEQIKSVRWCQSPEALFLTHPEIPPKKLFKDADEWKLENFTFMIEKECTLEPYHKFCKEEMTIASSVNKGSATLTTSDDFFVSEHVGMLLKIAEGYALIQTVTNATTATAIIKKKLVEEAADSAKLEPTRSFSEPAFSEKHGWPISVAFYQSRLIFGGSKKLPNTLWFSQSADLTNFELGSGYDAEGIEFSMLSDQSNTICALFAGRHLQVFTTSAEWMVSGDPLTPTNIQLRRQTQVGSPSECYIPPIGIDGATIFPSANGREIREFLFADIEQAYQATDLSLLAGHLINNPCDQAYDKHNRQAYIVMGDGTMCVLCSFRSEDLQSWTQQQTQGEFMSVCISGATAYFIIKRAGVYYLECFDENMNTDSGLIQITEEATNLLTVPDYLYGKTLKICADDIVLGDEEDVSDTIELSTKATKIEAGLEYTHIISPLPPSAGATNSMAPVSSYRLVKACFRLVNTNTLEVDTGSGVRQEMPYPLDSYKLDSYIRKKTADIVVRALGWNRSPSQPLWRIVSGAPKNFKLVSVTHDLQIGG